MHIRRTLEFPLFSPRQRVRVDPVLLVGASRVESGVFLVSARVRPFVRCYTSGHYSVGLTHL